MRYSLCFLLTLIASFALGDEAPSFNNEVLPVLTRYGCNSGGCHGKLAGQNGFRLSLRGFAPNDDFEAIAREGRGRRVSPASPMHSLLIRKATGDVAHGGGTRFAVDSRAAEMLSRWIGSGIPAPRTDEPSLVELEVDRSVDPTVPVRPGDKVALRVMALYDDGQRSDVTWLTSFASNDPATVSVSPEGIVTANRSGETVVRAAFGELVVISEFTIPFENQIDPNRFAARNNDVDAPVFDKLAALGIAPAGLCDDATFLRRASLDATGVLPTPEEVRSFINDTRPDKRQQLVEELLNRPEFIDYWTHWLADLLQNRKERDHDVRGTKDVRAFHAWIRQQVATGRSWREIASEVLTATGNTTENPAVGYFVVTVGEKEAHDSEVGDSVAQAFMGTRIGCAKCHNHPLEKYTQDDYYHFIGFFSRVALDRQNSATGPTELVIGTRHLLNLRKQIEQQTEKLKEDQAALGSIDEAANSDDAAKIRTEIENHEKRIVDLRRQIEETRQSKVEVRQPRTGQMLPPQPLDRSTWKINAGSDPRETFVRWLTDPHNEQFSGAMVNRLWKHFLGVGLVEPVDDLRATNPPSNRELWNLLNREFVGSDYDMKHIMRLIMNSRTYQLAADTTPTNFRDQRFYSHFQARRLPAEVMLDAICSATDHAESFAGYPRGMRATQIPDPFTESYFLTMFGRAPRTTACACERENDVTLPQLLHLQNSDDLAAKLNSPEGRLQRLLREHSDDSALVEEIYLATVSRLPTEPERVSVMQHFQNADRNEVALDLFWALLNTSEFTFNH